MSKYSALLLLMICTRAGAFDVFSGSGVSLPDIPSPDPKYHDAINKAAEATFKQSGFKADVDKAADVTTKKVTAVANTAISYTPFKPEHVFFVGGVTYAALVKKEVTKSFKNPMFPNVTNTISVSDKNGTPSGSLTWRFSW